MVGHPLPLPPVLLQICRRPSWMGAGCPRRCAEGVRLAQIITQNAAQGAEVLPVIGGRWWCSADILKRCPRCWWWSAGAHGCQNRRPGCRGGAGGGGRFYIYNKVKTKFNLFISVKNSIKYEFILFFIWKYKNKYLPLHQIIKVSPPQMRHK